MKWYQKTKQRNGNCEVKDQKRLGTLNMMTLNTTAAEIVDLINEEIVDILCLQELRAVDATLARFRKMIRKHELVFYCGAATRGTVLTAILCRRHLVTAKLDQQNIGFPPGWPYEDNATFIKVEGKDCAPLLLASCYGPHYDLDARQFYSDMGAVLAARARCYVIIGDHNTTGEERAIVNIICAGAFHTLDNDEHRSLSLYVSAGEEAHPLREWQPGRGQRTTAASWTT